MKPSDSMTLILPGFEDHLTGSVPEKTEFEKFEEARFKMLKKEENRLEIERRAKAMRYLIHNWKYGLNRYGIRHVASTDMLNDYLEIEKKSRGEKDCYKNNLNGAVVHNDNRKPGEKFVKLDGLKSKREGSHAREIKLWTMEKYLHIAKSSMPEER